ncbi:hypothetical protein [Longispora albida]|uniref:hypothetical protein n=1 Tax=Longispora albida TaxID=203523 RepID=UPI00037CF134|nr:hypothetical protein [Longispora albida]
MHPLHSRDTRVDPLVPGGSLLPLSERGGVTHPIAHTPGALRPFAATLARPMQPASKNHDTVSTSNTRKDPTEISADGKVTSDTNTVVTTDT